MNNIKSNSGIGNIHISDEVIALITGTSVLEIDGVYAMAGNFANGISLTIGRKNLSKGVKVEIINSDVLIDINLIVKFGCKINDLCKLVQQKVKNSVETMTGLKVVSVNVVVSGIEQLKDKPVEL